VFLYEDDSPGAPATSLREAAEIKTRLYGQKPGVHAGVFRCGGKSGYALP
jgi:hypothetical protein